MASTTTKLSNIINPEVMSDMIEAKIEAQCKITPYAHVNTDLQGTAGDTITVPSWNYIGDAEDFDVEKASDTNKEIDTTNLTAGSTTFTIKCAMKAVSILQTSINSGLGNPIGQATLQLAKSIVNKVDNDLIDAIYAKMTASKDKCITADEKASYRQTDLDHGDRRLQLARPLPARRGSGLSGVEKTRLPAGTGHGGNRSGSRHAFYHRRHR